MKPELAAVLAQLVSILQADSEPVTTDPPGTINGHSIEADEDGFSTVPEWDNILLEEARRADLTPKELNLISVKLPQRLVCRSVVENCTFPSPEAKRKAQTNLVRRRSVPGASAGLGGDPFSYSGMLFRIEERPKPDKRDWNVSDEDWSKRFTDLVDYKTLECENGEGAWSGNYDPDMNVPFFNVKYRQKVKDEIAAIRRKPEPFVPFGGRR